MEHDQTQFIIGVDVGGTFTDGVAVDVRSGQILTAKALTTYPDPTGGVIETVTQLAREGGMPAVELLARTIKFAHGTTLTTNLMFTRSGARTGLIATRGFGDQILMMRAIGRVAGRSLSERRHFRTMDKPIPLVPKHLIREVSERIDYKGSVLVPLDPAEVESAIGDLLAQGVEAIAVGLLWSFKNPVHEELVGEIARRLSAGTYVSLSSEIAPVIGEYERTATTIVNSYVGPLMRRYLGDLEKHLREMG